ncbi:gastric inhibitory polypeptide [Mugil cephalus]|uniref:gastric inhibitory polypeptide n=1 Tax=Mugil cephalus TaxID=48193 RepID=UPI001FB60E92|nr:gastric inhibitory polypeptide [Mugil cephalus]
MRNLLDGHFLCCGGVHSYGASRGRQRFATHDDASHCHYTINKIIMNALLCELLVICLLGALHVEANAQPEEMGENELHLRRRYAESTIASEISKIMDSMVQKNFVDFLLSEKEKRSKSAAVEEEPEERLYNDLVKLGLQGKQRKNI